MFRHPVSNRQQDNKKDFITEDRINQSIRFFKVPAGKEKSDVLDYLLSEINELKIIKPEKNRAKRLYIAIGSLASAACFLLFLLYFTFSFETYQGIQGENNIYFLPDSSKVILNTNSTVKFSKVFFNRTVSLTGEAYFEVYKGSKFAVKSPKGEVDVLGTRFSVSDSDEGFMVYCFEGNVKVKYREEEQQLSQGFKFYTENNMGSVMKFEKKKYPDFLFFNLSFDKSNVNTLWPVIENHFGVKIYTDIPVEKYFTGSFDTAELDEVIDIICISLGLESEKVSDNEIFIKTPL